jgi:hypothetical protein
MLYKQYIWCDLLAYLIKIKYYKLKKYIEEKNVHTRSLEHVPVSVLAQAGPS